MTMTMTMMMMMMITRLSMKGKHHRLSHHAHLVLFNERNFEVNIMSFSIMYV